MARISPKIHDRIEAGIRLFQPLFMSTKKCAMGESDAGSFITLMLAEIFGYDKDSELTLAFGLPGGYCGLATKIHGEMQLFVEINAIGSELNESHVRQAKQNAADHGLHWAMLTNGINWRLYKVVYAKSAEKCLATNLDFSALHPGRTADIESVYQFCKEAWFLWKAPRSSCLDPQPTSQWQSKRLGYPTKYHRLDFSD